MEYTVNPKSTGHTMHQEFKKLVSFYLHSVALTVWILQQEWGRSDLLYAVFSRQIPRQGNLHTGEEYQFHGIGCWVEFATYKVDFDFDFDGKIDGFDAWRLWLIAKQFPKEFPSYQELEDVEGGLYHAVRKRAILTPRNGERKLYHLPPT